MKIEPSENWTIARDPKTELERFSELDCSIFFQFQVHIGSLVSRLIAELDLAGVILPGKYADSLDRSLMTV